MRFIHLSSIGVSFASFHVLLHPAVFGEEVSDPYLNGLHSITARKDILPSAKNSFTFLNESTSFRRTVREEDMLYEVLLDEYYEEDEIDGVFDETLASGTSASTYVGDPVDRQKDIWNLIKGLDSFKQHAMWSTVEGKRKLTRLKYMVVPVWWSNQDTNDPALMMDIGLIQQDLVNVTNYYTDMSWSGFLVEWEILAQTKLLQSSQSRPNMRTVNSETVSILTEAGHIRGTHYDGVSNFYWKADNGNLGDGAFGVGDINGLDQWIRYFADARSLSFKTIRHELGHNTGHPHHQMMQYDWRLTRKLNDLPTDGFDMMSGGGNGYEISDFGAGSKWFWGWIPDTLVAHMQPEGSTLDCPTCQSDGNFMLYAFDDKNISPEFLMSNPNTPEANKMGIHIPLSFKDGRLYSYWISYRGNNPAKVGLSVHLVRYNFKGAFGATYDSWNYDVNGDTATRFDSFVEPGECYYIGPSGFTKDIDIASVDQVHPVVCNLEMVEGQRVKIHVEFLDMANLPEGEVSANIHTLDCTASSGSTTNLMEVDANAYNLVQVQNTGYDGTLSIDFCSAGSGVFADLQASAFVYDDYPVAPLKFGSKASYGSFKSLAASIYDCCESGSNINVLGALVVRVKQNRPNHLHLTEIEIFDESNINVAPAGQCFSRSRSDTENGDANCLNDGDVSDDACSSHSANMNVNNFDYCVLSAPTNISKIKVFPLQGDGSFNSRMGDLQLEVFAFVTGQENEASFSGLLFSEQITTFTTGQTAPSEFSISIPASVPCPNNVSPSLKSLSYKTLYGKAYVLIPPSTSSGTIPANTKSKIEVSCSWTQCLQNEYLSNGVCTSCPLNARAPVGSTDSSSCSKCPAGTLLPHPLSTDCAISSNHISIFASKGWRIWADPSNLSHLSDRWRIKELEFYESQDCSGNKVDTSVGTAIASGSLSDDLDADNAFGGLEWLGILDSDGFNWVGMNFDTEILVQCIKVFTGNTSKADALRVQAYEESNAEWVNVWIENDLDQTPSVVHTIPLVGVSNSMTPSDQPSLQPSTFPSESDQQSDSPSSLPSLSPSVVPSNEPSSLEVTLTPSSLPSMQPSKTDKPSFVPSSMPSDIPSFEPSTLPSELPSYSSNKPSFNPSSIPSSTNSNICKDSGVKFKKNTNTDGEFKKRSCAWLLRNPLKKQSRCEFGNKQRLKTHCPNTCGACEEYKCADSEKKWFLWGNTKKVRDCKWVASSKNPNILARRCNKNGVAATCRATCKYTDSTLGLSC